VSLLFVLDGDGNRHAEPDIDSYLRAANLRVARDKGTILFGSRDLCLASICREPWLAVPQCAQRVPDRKIR
jgi:hypothetical protein